MHIIVGSFVLALLLGWLTGFLAARKGEPFALWFIFGTLLAVIAIP
jgi:hypothetical protein